MTDHLTWVSATPMIPLLVGNLMLARQNRWGWVVTGLGDVAFIAYGMATGQYGFALDVVFLGVRIHGWSSWRKRGRAKAVFQNQEG